MNIKTVFQLLSLAHAVVLASALVLASPASAQDLGWKVWVKTSPCSGRFDWVTVAKENPTYGAGGGNWENADLILTGTGMKCVRNTDQFCSKAAATAEAAIVGASSKFSDYCCKEYSVWQNSATSKMTVVVGKFATAGYGWQKIQGDLCCSEAEALSGIAGACGGSRQQGGGSASSQCSQPPAGCQLQQVTTQPETRDGGGRITVESSLIHMMNCPGGPTYIYQYVNRRGFRVIHPPNWSNAIGGRDFGTCQEAQTVAVSALRPGAHPAGSEGTFAVPPLPPGGGGRSASSQCSQPPAGCQLQQVTTQPETRDGGGRITVEASLIHMMNCPSGPTYIYQYVNRRGFRVIHPPNWSNAIGGRDFGTCQEAQAVAVNSGQAASIGSQTGGGTGVGETGAWMSGTFDTSYGKMTLSPSGGRYDQSGGQLVVTSINGATMEGKWNQTGSGRKCPDGSFSGRFRFVFTSGGFSGTWGYCNDAADRSGWSGTRK